jgi:hypothetical protein
MCGDGEWSDNMLLRCLLPFSSTKDNACQRRLVRMSGHRTRARLQVATHMRHARVRTPDEHLFNAMSERGQSRVVTKELH